MPGWYIHMDTARKAVDALSGNKNAEKIFASKGLNAKAIADIAHANPAYVALGSIGPDIFFFLPDYMGSTGAGLYPVVQTIYDIYNWWDTNFVGPYEATLQPIANQNADQIAAITGGLSTQLAEISASAMGFLQDAVVTLMVRQYDVFGLMGSAVQRAYDESSFYWSDMLHYRQTSTFAGRLWQLAGNEASPWKERFQAFALGWMSHIATDVAGHAFVNEKCGGPYRLHWQRHHLVENHMDALVYNTEHGSSSTYQMLSCAALHLWITFEESDGSSQVNSFVPLESQAALVYPLGDDAASIQTRQSILDQDPHLPDELAQFIVKTMKDVYSGTSGGGPAADGQWKPSPLNLSDIVPGIDVDGFPSADDVTTTYWWLYKYIKMTTTDFFKLRSPSPPPAVIIEAFPAPPTGGDIGAGSASGDFADVFQTCLDILAWLEYIAQVVIYPATLLAGIITSAGTYPVRSLLYELVEVPLYNAWMALHWQLAMSGFALPMQSEINTGLTTLGTGVSDNWTGILAALQTLDGGLNSSTAIPGTESSGQDKNQQLPLDVVVDPPGWLESQINQSLQDPWSTTEAPSEFLRPWKFPTTNNNGAAVPPELQSAPAGPFVSGQDATILMNASPGDNAVRAAFEGSGSPEQTIEIATTNLPVKHLGDAVDFTAYMIARLTRAEKGLSKIANFNLDSDRGYGFLSWDWVRSHEQFAVPQSSRAPAAQKYNAPSAPGTGWNNADLQPAAATPKQHDESDAVGVRYLDKQGM